MDAVMFSSSVDRSMSNNSFNHHNMSCSFPGAVSNGGDGILMKPPAHPSFSSGGRPPLLPLPTNTKPYSSFPFPVRTPNNSNNKRGRRALLSSSPPPTNKKPLPSKNPSKSSTSPKKQGLKSRNESVDIRLGPEPSDLPKQVYLKAKDKEEDGVVGDLNSIFCLAPPPSSLPLPKFFLKPKLASCNVEAVNWGGMEDDGATATDNLRRLLRLC